MIADQMWNLATEIADYLRQFLAWALHFCFANWKYLVAAVALLPIVSMLCKYWSWRRGWLSDLIDQEIRQLSAQRRHDQVAARNFSIRRAYWLSRSRCFRFLQGAEQYLLATPQDARNVNFPSTASFFVILLVFLIVFFAPHYSEFLDKPSEAVLKMLSDKEVVKKVFEGLILIAVALIIFVAETIRESKNTEQKRALLRISSLWPLTLAVTLFPLGYFAGETNAMAGALLVFISLTAIYKFGTILRNLLSADAQGKNIKAFLKERIHSLIMESARERVGNNILFQKLGSGKELKIHYVVSQSWIERKNYIFIDYPQPGWLSDINFNELHAISRLLEAQAQKLGFETDEGKTAAPGAAARTSHTSQSQPRALEPKKIFLLKRFREEIPRESLFSVSRQAILAVPKELAADQGLIDEIRRRIAEAFRLTSAEPSSVAFRREMQNTKDQLVSAIRSISLGSVDELSQTYLDVAEEFLETLHELGGGYTAEQAQKERGDWFAGWSEIRWLTQDVRELITVSASTDNSDIIRNLTFLPFAIATRAVVANDHLLFQEFTSFASLIYYLAVSKPASSPVRNILADRSWRYLKEICEYFILPITHEVGGRPVDVIQAKDFALYAFKVFQDILKQAYESVDIETFQTVLNEVQRLFKNSLRPDDFENGTMLQVAIDNTENKTEKENLQKRLAEHEKKVKAFREITLGREEAIFGLAAHILDKLINEAGVEKHEKFYRAIAPFLPSNLSRLTDVFQKVKNFRSSNLFDWTRWDISADGEAHFVDTETKPNRLYWVRALQILDKLDGDAISKLSLPPSESAERLLAKENGQEPPTILAPFFSEQGHLGVLTASELEKIEIFKGLLRKATEAAKRKEEDELIAAELDTEKIESFNAQILKTRNEFGRLRSLMARLGAFTPDIDRKPGKEISSWGYNQLDDKGAFVAQYRVSYPSWGENYGRGIAQSEDKIGFETLTNGAATKLKSEKSEIFKTIVDAIKAQKLENPVIIHSLLSLFEFTGREDNDFFIPRYRKDCPKTSFNDVVGFSGVLKIDDQFVPVISIFVAGPDLKGRVLIADLKRFAHWHQYSPVDEVGEEKCLHDFTFIRVIDLNVDNELREKIIEDNPEYLRDQADKDRYLRTRAVVKVYEKFMVEILDANGGISIQTDDSD